MKTQTKIILASTSPRRKALLARLINNFEIMPSDYKEDMTLNLPPSELAKTLSHGKATGTAKKANGIIIGSDTFIALENEILGKPHTPEKAKEMLKKLSGKTHEIYTGITIINTETKQEIQNCEITKITFKKLSVFDLPELSRFLHCVAVPRNRGCAIPKESAKNSTRKKSRTTSQQASH